jgi:hypothetical protein
MRSALSSLTTSSLDTFFGLRSFLNCKFPQREEREREKERKEERDRDKRREGEGR